MWQPRFFKLTEEVKPEIVDLLTEVTLGTTGVRYKHLDTAKRVHQVDEPLFYYLQRREKVLANITFCRRAEDWYIRYFAFRTALQRSTDTKSEDHSNSLLKKEIESFFQAGLNGEIDHQNIQRFYAYIDPKNDRSLWMSKNFGFNTIAELSTQTFSRVFPKRSKRFEWSEPTIELQERIKSTFGNHSFFFEAYLPKDKMALIKDDKGEILAFCRVSMAHWRIDSLGGKLGEFQAKVLPYIPIINRLVNPKLHTFVVPDSVWVKDGNPQILTELYESLIKETKANMLIWWADNEEPLYKTVKNKVNWGPMNSIMGVSPVNVVARQKEGEVPKLTQPMYVVAIDAI